MQAHLARRRAVPAEIKELLDSIRGASMRSPDDHDEFGALVSTISAARGHVACPGRLQKRPTGMLVLTCVLKTCGSVVSCWDCQQLTLTKRELLLREDGQCVRR